MTLTDAQMRRFEESWEKTVETGHTANKQLALIAYAAACADAKGLVDAAQAVIDRWDSPKWKDVPPTADSINALRRAVKAWRGE